MNRSKPTESKRDERGVSETLGVILLFGLLVIALTVVQVNAVPTQNSKVEYAHDQDARTDFQEVRTAIIETAGADEPRSATVDLGVTYPGRLLFLNPGPVNGNLGTVDAGKYDATATGGDAVDLQQVCGIDTGDGSGVPTKALEYGIDYNVYSGDATHRYENSVVHQRSGTNGATLVHNDQQLIRGSTISLYPLVGDVQYSGTSGQSLDFVSAGTSTVTQEFENEWTLTVPSSLNADRWGSDDHLLAEELARTNPKVLGVTDSGTDGHVDVAMAAGTYDFRCTIVGVNEMPDGVTPIDDTGEDADENDEINPVGDGVLVYKNANVDKNTGNVRITFENDGAVDSASIEVNSVRLPFYSADSQGSSGGENARSATFDTVVINNGGGYSSLPDDTKYDIDPAEDFTVEVQFYCALDASGDIFTPGTGDYFALNLRYTVDDAEKRSTYFISPISDVSGNKRCKASDAGTSSEATITFGSQTWKPNPSPKLTINKLSVTDSDGIDTIAVTVTKSTDNTEIGSISIPVSGASSYDQKTDIETTGLAAGDGYDVTVVVTNSNDNTYQATATGTA